MATTLFSLAERLRVGDKVQWKGTKADVDSQKPKTVTRIEHAEDSVRVVGEGPKGGTYWFSIDADGESRAVFVDPDQGEQGMGAVEIARLVWPGDSRIPV